MAGFDVQFNDAPLGNFEVEMTLSGAPPAGDGLVPGVLQPMGIIWTLIFALFILYREIV